MRKINLALISAFVLLNSSCSTNEDPSLALNQDSESYAKTRTIEDAVTLANRVSAIDTRSRGAKIATMSDVKVVTSHPSRSGEVDTLFYAVNYPDREGFALIAAPTSVTRYGQRAHTPISSQTS
jgi:hypothetical protein